MAFKEETVLVLGAGASMHYGYPSGEELVDDIIECIDYDDKIKSCLIDKEATDKDYRVLSNKLKFYDPLSIDSFLMREGLNDPEIVELGKIMIAYHIVKKENPNIILRQNKISKNEAKKNLGNWYRFLLNSLFVGTTPDEFINQNINLSLITFNYDFSLEYYLHSRLSSSLYINETQKEALFKKINDAIYHVYGDVLKGRGYDNYGFICHQDGFADIKTEVLKPSDLLKCAKHLKDNLFVIEEERNFQKYKDSLSTTQKVNYENRLKSLSDTRGKIKQKIASAQHIYFLGFGFNDDNLKVLGLDDNSEINAKAIYYTNIDQSEIIRKKVDKIFSKSKIKLNRSDLAPFESTKDCYGALAYDFNFPPS